jgi:prevent-host-death family protein
MKSWPLQDAKAKFSAVVDEAMTNGPQRVSRRGRDVVVVLSVEAFQKLSSPRRGRREGLVEFFRDSPLAELPRDAFKRQADAGREVSL